MRRNDDSFERRVARIERELRSLQIESPRSDAAAIRKSHFRAVAERAAQALKEDHTLIELSLWTGWNRRESPVNYHSDEEMKYGVRDKKAVPTDAMREDIRRMKPGEKLDYAELNLAPKKADRL